MAKTFMVLSVTFLGAVLLAAGSGTCCLPTPKADVGSQPCHRHPSSAASQKGAFDGCCPVGKPCGCEAKETQVFFTAPDVWPGEKVRCDWTETGPSVRWTLKEPTAAFGTLPDVRLKHSPHVPLYLLHRIFLL